MDTKKLIPKRRLDISGKDEKEFGLAVCVMPRGYEEPVVYLIKKKYEEKAESILRQEKSSIHDAASLGRFLGDEISSDLFFDFLESDLQGLKSTQESCFAFYRVKLSSALRRKEIFKEKVKKKKPNPWTKRNNYFGERHKSSDFSPESRIDEISAKPAETKTLLQERAKSAVSRYAFFKEISKTPINEESAVEIYDQVQAYCDNHCTERSNLNPVSTCQKCKIMEIKREALPYTNKSS
jgi:hypothetical protein